MAKILVAEDDENVRGFVVRTLELNGHEIIEAEDGGLATQIIEEEQGQFDLLLSDIKMPILDGIGLALSIGAKFPNITILLMTGYADQRERAHGLDSLVYDVITKPFNLKTLVKKVDDALLDKPIEIVSLARSGLQNS